MPLIIRYLVSCLPYEKMVRQGFRYAKSALHSEDYFAWKNESFRRNSQIRPSLIKISSLFLVLFLLQGSMSAQYNQNTSAEHLAEYTEQFDIQFAYCPEKLRDIKLEVVGSIEELRLVFSNVNVSILEIDDKRWLLRNDNEKSDLKSSYVKGQVIGSDGNPLVSALIYTDSGKYSTLTDENGSFYLEIPESGEYQICCQYLGFKALCLPFEKGLTFELEPLAMLIENVEIQTKKVQCKLSALDDSEVLNLKSSGLLNASLGKDVMRSVQMLGGVDASNDLSAALNVRATAGLQSLVTLDGIPIYNAESAFGMFSVLNPMVVTKAELYKNSMPLEYGEFTGGYLAANGLTQIHDKVRLNIDLNTLQSSAAIQVPLGKRSQINGAFRKSNGRISNKQYYSKLRTRNTSNSQFQQFLKRPQNIQTSLENEFADAYFNFAYEGKRSSTFNISLFGNGDITGSSYDYSSIFERKVLEDIKIDEKFIQSKAKANIGLSVKYVKKFKSENEFMFLLYSSSYGLRDSIKSGITFSNSNIDRKNFYNSAIINSIRDNNIKFQYLTNPERPWSTKVGVDFRRLKTDFLFRSNNISPFRQRLEIPSMTPYAGIQYNHKNIFIANFGIRNAIIPIENPISFASPRVKLLLKINAETHLKSSLSFNQQYFRPIELERQLGQSTSANIIATNKDIPIMKSVQMTFGANYFKSGFKFNGDVFLKENSGILEQVLSMPGLSDETNVFGNNSYELFSGTNKVVGLDVTSSYEKESLLFLLSYTLSKSEDNFEDLFNDKPIPDQNNRTHQWNFFSSFIAKPWTFSTTYVYGSGIYTLDRSALDQDINRVNIDPTRLFKQLPAYNRWDISLSYCWDTKIGDISLDLGIFNLLNTNNVNSELYIYTVEDEDKMKLGGAEINLLGRIWTVGVRYEL